MRLLTLLFSFFLGLNVALAGNDYDASELTDAALISEVEAIADELESNSHDQEIMNMVYNRARLVRKSLNRYLNKIDGLDAADDDDILPLLEDVVTQIQALTHTKKELSFVKKHLDQSLIKLEENRQTATEIAVLSFDDSNVYNFGGVFTGGSVGATFIITNSGNGDAQVQGESGLDNIFNFLGSSDTYPGSFGTCGAVIAAGTSCTVVVQFQPVAVQIYNGSLVIDYFDGVNSQQLSKDLTGTGL